MFVADSVGDLAAAIAPPEGEDPPLGVNLVGELVASPEGEYLATH